MSRRNCPSDYPPRTLRSLLVPAATGLLCVGMGCSDDFAEAVSSYLAFAFDRLLAYSSAVCSWDSSRETIRNTFGRFAFPIIWDYAEVLPIAETSGGYAGAVEWIGLFIDHALLSNRHSGCPRVVNRSSTKTDECKYDIILTDPPYYDAKIGR